MHNESRITGSSVAITFTERVTTLDKSTGEEIATGQLVTYDLSMAPLTDADISELDSWLRSQFIRMVRNSLEESMSDRDKELELAGARRQAAGLMFVTGDGARAMASVDGMARVVWQGIRKNHPEITLEKLRKLLFSPENMEAANDSWEEANLPASPTKKKHSKANPEKKKRAKRKASAKAKKRNQSRK